MSQAIAKRSFLAAFGAAALAAAAFTTPFAAKAQGAPYPNRAITIIVPYTAGTTADTLSRLLGARLSERWNVPVITDNRSGASGVIGSEYVAKAKPDGYTLMFTATSHATLPAFRPKLPFDPIKSFAQVSLLGTSAMGFVVSPKIEAKTVKEFIELAKSQPGKMDYSSPGAGGVQHLAMESFMQETGTHMTHVPYKGTAGALTDVMAGHVQATVASLQSAGQLVNNGQLKMLAVMSDERSPAFPSVPTMKESGLPNLVVDTWYGAMAPAGTPPEIVARLSAELDALLKLPEVREAMAKQGVAPVGGAPERLHQLLTRDIPRWTKLVNTAQIKID